MAMTHSTNSLPVSDEYYPQNDEAELERLQGLANTAGLGDDLTDDESGEFADVMRDLGYDLKAEK
jgi:hypothetical protein